MFGSKIYSLRKSRRILQWGYQGYKRRIKQLKPDEKRLLEGDLQALDEAILRGDREEADRLARKTEIEAKPLVRKSFFEYSWELAIALVFALVVATVIRQMWFEPFEIPTGSMRPTFEEQDHLTVSKTQFGLNIPLMTAHFYFDPALVQRTGVVIFSGDNIPLRDTDSTYLGLIPYKKRYIKRLIGKPGDSFYFYGGKLYGVDKQGVALKNLLDSPWLKGIEHIPFLDFEGDRVRQANGLSFLQMHQPIGRIVFDRKGAWIGEVFNGRQWIKDDPEPVAQNSRTIRSYGDFMGINNFAMARLLTRHEVESFTHVASSDLPDAPLYLELRHHPSLTTTAAAIAPSGFKGFLTTLVSVIPLQEEHIKALMDQMYTARFVVSEGFARRYSAQKSSHGPNSPRLTGIPDGTYEFYYGKAYRVGFGGWLSLLDKDSPLYSYQPAYVQKLYNVGVDFETEFEPYALDQSYFPHRYAYFRDGDLYLLGAPILKKDDPQLVAFVAQEEAKQKTAKPGKPYTAFKDQGPPLAKNGEYDVEMIRALGVTVSEKNYLVLGDNHAMSADSRVFGFVPEANLQGVPSWIFWPPGERWGAPKQPPYPVLTLSRLIVWSIASAALALWFFWSRSRQNKPIFKKL